MTKRLLMVNGQTGVGDTKFWRVDDMAQMESPDYNPIEYLRNPFALVNCKYVSIEELRAALDRVNAEAKG